MSLLLSLLTSLFIMTMAPAAKAAATETATFAAGCFWGSEEFFRKVPGVKETQVGYTGGTKKADYEEVSRGNTGHAEAVEIKFDPTQVSYEKLLTLFWKMHDPTTENRQGNDQGTQYRSAIFTHSEAQRQTALALKAKIEKSKAWKKPIVTQIVAAGPFFPAEEYHQKYLVKHPGGYDNHYLRDLNFN